MKRTLCILLSLMLAVTGFAGLCVPAAAADWQTGDVVTLGSYPQSRVTGDAAQSHYANDGQSFSSLLRRRAERGVRFYR